MTVMNYKRVCACVCVCLNHTHFASVFLHVFSNLTLDPLCSYVGGRKAVFKKILSWNIKDRL